MRQFGLEISSLTDFYDVTCFFMDRFESLQSLKNDSKVPGRMTRGGCCESH